MIDKIIKIEDFKKIMEKKKLKKEDLRICIIEKTQSEMATMISITLTIPKDKNIMECTIARQIFCTAFLHDKNFDDNKKFREMVKKAYDKAEKIFGKITQGNWMGEND